MGRVFPLQNLITYSVPFVPSLAPTHGHFATMVIKTTPQILKRISMRWLPYPAFENTDTIALNVGGYFMDLRIVTEDNSLEWSRAGERKELRRDPRKMLATIHMVVS